MWLVVWSVSTFGAGQWSTSLDLWPRSGSAFAPVLGLPALLPKDLGGDRAFCTLDWSLTIFFGGITVVFKKGTNNFLAELYG